MLDKFQEIFSKVQEIKFCENDKIAKNDILEFSKQLKIISPIEKARKNGNHSVIFGELDNRPVVLKTTSNPIFVSRTLTEIFTLIKLEGALNDMFSTPKILDFDFTDNKYLWFITTRESENYLDGNKKKDVETLAKATIALIRSEFKVPFKDKDRLETINEGNEQKLVDKLNDIAQEWSKEFSDDIEKLISIMNTYNIKNLPPTTVHGDLVARHIIALGQDKYQIYDWELTGGAYFWGYEPAYVFHRTYTRDGNEVLAKIYLEILLSLMNLQEKKLLIQSFRPMLAQRIIGGYKDYTDKDSNEYKQNKKLNREIESYKYLPYDLN